MKNMYTEDGLYTNFECLHNKLFKTWKFNRDAIKVYKAITFHSGKKLFTNWIKIIQFRFKIHVRVNDARYFNAEHVEIHYRMVDSVEHFNMFGIEIPHITDASMDFKPKLDDIDSICEEFFANVQRERFVNFNFIQVKFPGLE